MDIVTKPAVLRRWSDVPQFEDEREEARFWMERRLDPKLMRESLAGGDHTESTTITLRIDPRLLSRIKRLARSRYLNYQSMIKQWVSERLEAEFRDRGAR
jgi:predicted DNA binding CopG/RHH family protein